MKRPYNPKRPTEPEKTLFRKYSTIVKDEKSYQDYTFQNVIDSIIELYGEDHDIDFSKVNIELSVSEESIYGGSYVDFEITYDVPLEYENPNFSKEYAKYVKLKSEYKEMLAEYNIKHQEYLVSLNKKQKEDKEAEIAKAKELLFKEGYKIE